VLLFRHKPNLHSYAFFVKPFMHQRQSVLKIITSHVSLHGLLFVKRIKNFLTRHNEFSQRKKQ